MKLLLLGLNYRPEPVGIGPFTAGLAEWLAARGHQVRVVCGEPYYPEWRPQAARPGWGGTSDHQAGVEIRRCRLFVPARPTGTRRLLHHAGFAVAAAQAMVAEARRCRPDLVLAVAPSLAAVPAARLAARGCGAPLWLHIQDLELDAARATGLVTAGGRVLDGIERWALRADRVSAVSAAMGDRLRAKGVPADRVVELRNWADLANVRPLARPSAYRAEWGIGQPVVALYAGSFGRKQGLEVVLAAADRLRHRPDILFLLCGAGNTQPALAAAAAGRSNVRLMGLQPVERLGELLGLATLHLLPQVAGAADLVLPSKLANMLASGRPVVATAARGTGLAQEVAGCGRVVRPGDPDVLAAAVAALADDPRRPALGWAARRRAEERWNRELILARAETEMLGCIAAHRAG